MNSPEEHVSKLELIGWRIGTGMCYMCALNFILYHVVCGIVNVWITLPSALVIVIATWYMTRSLRNTESSFRNQPKDEPVKQVSGEFVNV